MRTRGGGVAFWVVLVAESGVKSSVGVGEKGRRGAALAERGAGPMEG